MKYIPAVLPLDTQPTPNSNDATQTVADVLETGLDIAAVLAASFAWVLGLVVATQIVGFVLRRLGKKHPLLKYLERRSRIPSLFTAAVLGVIISWEQSVPQNQSWHESISHGLLIALIFTITWWLMNLCGVLEDMTRCRMDETNRPSRLLTQAQVLHRVSQAFFAVSGVIAVALTFPAARTAMSSLLASAGIISLVAGIAAQGVLANMFAGLQIAFSDSIRVGDVVVVKGQQGTVEEITLTYILIHMWEGKRLILPSKKFVEDAFENWTKKDTTLLGPVELYVDWRLPMASLRTEVERLLNNTDLWDGRTANVQVTDSDAETMKVRVVVSASNSGDLWDLRCYMRENLLDWLQGEAPYALPRRRVESQEVTHVSIPDDEIEIERQVRKQIIQAAVEEKQLRQQSAVEEASETAPHTDPYGEPLLDQYARMIQEKRRSWRLKAQRLNSQTSPGTTHVSPANIAPRNSELTETKQLSTTATLSAERFFSGSPDAEERRRLISGSRPENTKGTKESKDSKTENTAPDTEDSVSSEKLAQPVTDSPDSADTSPARDSTDRKEPRP